MFTKRLSVRTILGLFWLAVSLWTVHANPQAAVPQRVCFPYWSTQGYGALVTFNNPTGLPVTVTPQLYNLSGQMLSVAPITLAPKGQLTANIADWVTAGGGGSSYNQGSLELNFNAPMSSFLGAQVSLVKPNNSVSFDVPPEDPSGFASSTLEGIWWRRGTGSQFNLVLTNTSSSSVTATVSFTALGSAVTPVTTNVTLGARQVQILNLNAMTLPSTSVSTGTGPITLGGVRVTSSGAPGTLLAYGMLSTTSIGFSSHVSLVDPAMSTSKTLVAPHLVMGAPDVPGFPAGTSFTAVACVRNASTQVIDVTPSVSYKTTKVGPLQTANLPVRQLQPSQVGVIDIKAELAAMGITGPFFGTSASFTTSGQNGSLLALTTCVDASATHCFDVPCKDPGITMNRYGGSYPWRLDGDFQSVVHLRNAGTAEATVTLQLDYAGGSYMSPLIILAPKEQIDIDLRELRDTEKRDSIDQVLPPDTTGGRLTWFEHGAEPVVGRMEIYSVSTGIGSSYSCAATCCPPTGSVYISPGPLNLPIGDQLYVKLLELRQGDCDPTVYGPFNVTARGTFTVGNPAIATVGDQVNLKRPVIRVGVGDTTLFAEMPTGEWVRVQNGCHFIAYNDSTEIPIAGGPKITGIDPPRAVVGISKVVSITGDGFGQNATVTVSGTGITVGMTSSLNTTVNVELIIADDATLGDHDVIVHVGPKTEKTKIFVQKPSRLVRTTKTDYWKLFKLLPPNYGKVLFPEGGEYNTEIRCGAYVWEAYDLMDQTGANKIEEPYKIREVFTNFLPTNSNYEPQPTTTPLIDPMALEFTRDIKAFTVANPATNGCPIPFTLTFTQGFVALIYSKEHNLTTTNLIEFKNVNGTYTITNTPTHE